MKRLLLAVLLPVIGLSQTTAKKIAIADFVVSQSEDGVRIPSGFVFVPGETIFLSARFGQFSTSANEERPELRLAWEAQVLDPAGIPIVEDHKANIVATLTPQDKDWMPKVRIEAVIPPLAGSGSYKFVLRVKDELNSSAAMTEIPFQVKGRDVEPSATLTVRNLRFYRGENDGVSLPSPAYRPGDPVWARFDMTGYKLGEGNSFDIGYGLEVFRPNGESIYKEPNAAELKEKSFYRKHYLPGVLNLNPSADITRGEYTIVLRVSDRLGGQQSETRHTFRIE